jgi:hypothetical protein
MIIHLGPRLLGASSSLPAGFGRAILKRLSIWPCSGWGLPCQPCHQDCGELLPRLFTFSRQRRVVCFLWHFPSGYPESALPTTLPCGARTFLSSLRTSDHLIYFTGISSQPSSIARLANRSASLFSSRGMWKKAERENFLSSLIAFRKRSFKFSLFTRYSPSICLIRSSESE